MGIYRNMETSLGVVQVNTASSQVITTVAPRKPMHILQVVQWKKYSAAEWVIQYNAWLNSGVGTYSSGASPLAIMIDKADTTKVRKSAPMRPVVKITDIEARAVAAVLHEMRERIDLEESRCAMYLILRYENDWTDKALSIMDQCTIATARKRQKKALEYFKKRTGCL